MLSYFKLADFVRTMQNERIAMGFRVFLGKDRKDKAEDLSEIFTKTDDALAAITWKRFGKEKIFRSKLRFQIRQDDFRSVNALARRKKENFALPFHFRVIIEIYWEKVFPFSSCLQEFDP